LSRFVTNELSFFRELYRFLISPDYTKLILSFAAKRELLVTAVGAGILLDVVIMLLCGGGDRPIRAEHGGGAAVPMAWTLFRLPLIPRQEYLTISLMLAMGLTGFYTATDTRSILCVVVFPMFAYLMTWAWRSLTKDNEQTLCVALLWGSCLLFGASHASNMAGAHGGILALSGYVGGKVVNGFLFSWVRIRLGFLWSVTGHIANNVAVVGVTLGLFWARHLTHAHHLAH
jgi:hypothetical protein